MKKLYFLLLAAFAFFGANAQNCPDTIYSYLNRASNVALYGAGSGYVSGTNTISLEVGNNYDNIVGGSLTDALIWFGAKKIIGTADSITIYVYNTGAADSLPTGTALASKKISVANIDTNFNNNPVNYTKVHFTTPIPITGRYAISVQVAGAGLNDTVGILTNAQGDGVGERRSFMRYNVDNSFYALADAWNVSAGVPIDVDLMILPIINACPRVTITGTTAICTGSTTTLTAHAIDGAAPYTYRWFNNTTDSTVVLSAAGTYTVTVTDAVGHTGTATVTTTIGSCGGTCTANASYTTPGLWPVSDSIPCVVDGQAYSTTLTLRNFTTYNGIPIDSVHIDSITNLPCGIIWTPNKASHTYNSGELGCILLAGTSTEVVGQYKMNVYVKAYSSALGTPLSTTLEALGFRRDIRVKATTGAVCTATNTSSVGSTAQRTCAAVPLTVSISGNTQICAGGSTTLTAAGTGGSGTYTYAWSGNTTGATKTVSTAGTYTVTVTSGSATATASVTVTSIAAATISISSTPNPPCAGQTNNFTATVTNAGTGTVGWFLNGSSVATGTTYAPTNLTAGNTVYAQVVPSNGCPTATSSTLTVTTCTTPLTVTISGNPQICSGQSTTLTATGAGGTGTYTYAWSGNTTGATKTVTTAGTYTVTVTSGSATATASVTTTVTTCGSSCTPNPAYTQAGIYPSSDSIPCIVQNQAYNTTVYIKNFDQVSFAGTTLTLDSITIDSITNLPCGITWVTNKAPRNNYNNSESGCIQVSGTSNDVVGQYKLGIWVTAYPQGLGGLGFPQELSALGIRKDLRVKASAGATCQPVDTFNTGVTAQRTCTTQPVQVTITGSTQICNTGGSTTLTATATGGSGTYTYAWSGNTTGATKTVSAAGVYSVTVTSGVSTATASVTVTANAPATISISSNPAAPCAAQSNTFTATVTGGGNAGVVTWLVNGNAVATGNTYTTSTLAAGNVVTAQIAPSTGCATVTSSGLTAVTCVTLGVSITGNTQICAGSSSTLTAVPNGGTSPYTFRWNNNTTASTLSATTAGTYTVTVTDAASHTATATVTTTVINCGGICTPDPTATQPGLYPANSDSIPCIVQNVPYSFSLTFRNFSTYNLQGQVITVDSVRIDTIGNLPCGITWTSDKTPFNTYHPNELGCVKLSGTTTDPVGQYKLNIAVTAYIGGIGLPFNGSALGIRKDVRVKATTGAVCNSVDTFNTGLTAHNTCTVVAPPTITITGSNSICQGSNTTLTANPVGGTSPYTYHWSNNASTVTTTVSAAGTYSVTVTDAANGTASASFTVTVAPATSITITSAPATPCANQSNTFTATTTNGGTPTINWLVNGVQTATGPTFTSATLQTGNVVTAQAVPSNSCPSATSNQIFVSSCNGQLNVFTTGPDTICAGGHVTLGLQVSGGTGTYTYTWSPATGLSATNIAHPVASPTVTTSYIVVVSDGTLSGSDTTTVVIKSGPSITLTPDVTICTGSTATLAPVVTNVSGSETYSWSPATNLSCTTCATTVASPTATTVYTITVTDAGVGCQASASAAVHVTGAAIPLVNLTASRSQSGATCDGANFFTAAPTAGGTSPAYVWTVNGTTVAGTNDTLSLDSLVAGDIVKVQLTSSLSCATPDTASSRITIGSCTGIEQLVLDQHVKLYPNPNDGNFVLTIDQNASQMDIQILNIQGRIIYAEHVKDYISGSKQFSLGELAKGVYLLKVSTEKGNAVKRLVIQ